MLLFIILIVPIKLAWGSRHGISGDAVVVAIVAWQVMVHRSGDGMTMFIPRNNTTATTTTAMCNTNSTAIGGLIIHHHWHRFPRVLEKKYRSTREKRML